MPFTAVTYNVLATAYLGRGDYSGVDHDLLDPDYRTPALVRHLLALEADVLCLQEVEADVFDALRAALEPFAYSGHIEFKGRSKPDGCATFFRTTVFDPSSSTRLEYHDDELGPGQHSGFLALLTTLTHQRRRLGVANTHLRWDKSGTPKAKQIGHRQAVELIEACRTSSPACDAWIVCGDFNRGPTSEVAATFRAAGFEFAHATRPQARSAVTNRRASLIDHLFYSPALKANPIDPPSVSDRLLLPSRDQPSDHLPIASEFDWRPTA